ncbi:MAG: hypothetical protein IH985_06550 [Planctomycetes bacterium]|nr:hypothetical protein [Planctomycetota bacterium]
MDSNGIEPVGRLRLAQAYEIRRPVQVEPLARRGAAPKVQRVVAGRVPGSIDFSADATRPTGPAIPMYRHPADRNVAATRVGLGRLIDLDA